MQKKHGFAPLGPATRDVKRAVFGLNAAEFYGVDVKAKHNPVPADYRHKLPNMNAQYREQGGKPSNAYYGWIGKTA